MPNNLAERVEALEVKWRGDAKYYHKLADLSHDGGLARELIHKAATMGRLADELAACLRAKGDEQ